MDRNTAIQKSVYGSAKDRKICGGAQKGIGADSGRARWAIGCGGQVCLEVGTRSYLAVKETFINLRLHILCLTEIHFYEFIDRQLVGDNAMQ